MAAYAIAIAATKKPAVMRVIGRNFIPTGKFNACLQDWRNEVLTSFSQERVDNPVDDWDEDDDGQWVDILHNVVRNPMELHSPGLRDEVIQHLLITHPKYRVIPVLA